MKDLFRKAGQVIRADVALNQEGRSKGHGTVLFATIEDAQKAIGNCWIYSLYEYLILTRVSDAYNGYKWLGRVLEVRADRGFVDNEKKNHATREETATSKKDAIPEQEPEEPEEKVCTVYIT
jgi:RNA recognition motif-containing protein